MRIGSTWRSSRSGMLGPDRARPGSPPRGEPDLARLSLDAEPMASVPINPPLVALITGRAVVGGKGSRPGAAPILAFWCRPRAGDG